MAYPDLVAARTRAIALSGVADADIAYVTELLDMSKATLPDSATVEYRPFWVAAKIREQKPRAILEADGVVFNDYESLTNSLYSTQSGLDSALSLTVPAGMESLPSDCDRCGEVAQRVRRYPVTVRTIPQ